MKMNIKEAKIILQCRGKGYSEDEFNEALEIAYSALDSLSFKEQPEVDEEFFFDEVLKVYDDNNKYPPRSEEELTMLEIIARHFYELGLNARKEDKQ